MISPLGLGVLLVKKQHFPDALPKSRMPLKINGISIYRDTLKEIDKDITYFSELNGMAIEVNFKYI